MAYEGDFRYSLAAPSVVQALIAQSTEFAKSSASAVLANPIDGMAAYEFSGKYTFTDLTFVQLVFGDTECDVNSEVQGVFEMLIIVLTAASSIALFF